MAVALYATVNEGEEASSLVAAIERLSIATERRLDLEMALERTKMRAAEGSASIDDVIEATTAAYQARNAEAHYKVMLPLPSDEAQP